MLNSGEEKILKIRRGAPCSILRVLGQRSQAQRFIPYLFQIVLFTYQIPEKLKVIIKS